MQAATKQLRLVGVTVMLVGLLAGCGFVNPDFSSDSAFYAQPNVLQVNGGQSAAILAALSYIVLAGPDEPLLPEDGSLGLTATNPGVLIGELIHIKDGYYTGASISCSAAGLSIITLTWYDPVYGVARDTLETSVGCIGDADPTTSIVMADPIDVPADGVSLAQIVVQLKDVNGYNLVATTPAVVTLTTTLGTLSDVKYDLSNHTRTATISSAAVGTATIRAQINGVEAANFAVVNFVADEPECEPPQCLGEGLFSLPGLTLLEGMARLGVLDFSTAGEPSVFGPFGAHYAVAVAGANGVAIVDLADYFVDDPQGLLHFDNSLSIGNGLGVAPLLPDNEDPDLAGLFVFGTQAMSVIIAPPGAGFGSGQLFADEVVYDASAAAGGLLAQQLVFVMPMQGVGFSTYDAESREFWADAEVLAAALFDGELVSAFLPHQLPGSTSPLLILDRAVDSGLYVDQRNGSGPVRVMNLGLDARKLRCVYTAPGAGDYLCAVSVFGADRVTTFNWDPSLAGASGISNQRLHTVGDGPVGIDLVPLPDDTFALLSTGFNGNSYTELHLDASGNRLDGSTKSVPAGCTGPGHAIYVVDEAGLVVVGTCYTTSNLFLRRSSLVVE